MFPSIYLLGTDYSHFGGVDYASLPQQALMEMLIKGKTNGEIICGSQEKPKDIQEWKGVTLNENGEVTKIGWEWLGLEGSLNLE